MKMKKVIISILLLGILKAARYSEDFGLHEWRKKLLNKPVDLINVGQNVFLAILKKGFNHISHQGNYKLTQ